MRILHAIQRLDTGGAERVLVQLAQGAKRAGHDIAVAAAPGALSRELDAPTYPLPLIERHSRRLPHAAVALDRSVRGERPDLVHFHNPGMAAVGAIVTLRGHRARGLVTVHGVPDDDYAAAARVLRIAGLPAVACGPGVAAGLAERGYEVQTTIVNGVRPPPPPADARVLREEWGVAPDEPLIVSVGRLVPQKNQALAIRALARMPRGALAILGDGPLLADLRRQAEADGISERVVFAGVRSDAPAVMGAADVVVLPSRWEGLPLVGLEALAAGTPLVATGVRGVRELLTDEVDALLVPPDDPTALAAALRRVLEDAGLRQRLLAGGRHLTASYGVDAMVDGYLRLYERLVSS